MTGQTTGQVWYTARDGKQTGPMSDAEIHAIARLGYFREKDLVWRAGFADWQPAFNVFPPQPVVQPPPVPNPPPPAVALKPAVAAPVPTQAVAPAPASEAGERSGQWAQEPRRDGFSELATANLSRPATVAASVAASAVAQPEPVAPQPQVQTPKATHYNSQTALDTAYAERRAAEAAAAAAAAPVALENLWPSFDNPRPEPVAPTPAAREPFILPSAPMAASAPVRTPANPAGSVASSTAAVAPAPLWPQPRSEQPRSEQPRPEPLPLKPLFVPSAEPTRLPLNLPRTGETSQRPQTAPPGRQPSAASATASTPTTAVQKNSAVPEAMPEASPARRSNKMAVAALIIVVAAVTVGVWIAAKPDLVSSPMGTKSGAGLAKSALSSVTKSLGVAEASSEATLDAQWQQTAHWPVIKREFPDWYGERLRETAKLQDEKKPEAEITKGLVEQMVALRRQNASSALSAGTPKLKALATAFLDNLRQLKSTSTTQCFDFISRGETSPGVIDLLAASAKPAALQLQVAAIFDAIGEGRKTPVTHEKPQKADYDQLMAELAKLGWTQTDVATFADPRALARAEPERVCQMVQDWFVAHIAITDAPAQDRLLSETLRPVVSG